HSLYKDIIDTLDEAQAHIWWGDLLREAVRVDPSDAVAREMYIELMKINFDYYIHEVPVGLLVDPEEFSKELDEFTWVVQAHGAADRYKEALNKWRVYCDTFRDYLSKQPRC